MAHAYTPGLKVSARTRLRRLRLLPIPGEVRVAAGERVAAQDVAAQTFMAGDVTPLNLANLLSVPPAEVPDCMLKREGDRVELGEPLARTKGIFGLFKTECRAKAAGTIESVSPVTGQVMIRGEPIPIRVLAYLAGEVVEVWPQEGCAIEAEAAFVQGIFGVGGEAFGPLRIAGESGDRLLTPELIRDDMGGCVVAGAGRLTIDAIRAARDRGVAALVAGGIDDLDLAEFLGYDLGVAITGSEQLGLTLILTEGFGDIQMADRTFALLAEHEGAAAAVNGATQIRAGVIRPEIILPLPDGAPAAGGGADERGAAGGVLAIGAPVRIIRDPHFGVIGTVSALPPDPQVLESGSRARVLEVEARSGDRIVVPRANVELIEE